MRHSQISKIQKVEIQGAGFMESASQGPSGLGFNGLEFCEEVEWGEVGGEFDGGIKEEGRVLRAIHGGGLIDF